MKPITRDVVFEGVETSENVSTTLLRDLTMRSEAEVHEQRV